MRLPEASSKTKWHKVVVNKIDSLPQIKTRIITIYFSVIGLALGKKVSVEEEITVKNPYSIKSGGMVNMQALKTGKVKTEDAYDTGIGTQFSVETNKRDEDQEMLNYIERKMSKQKGDNNSEDKTEDNKKYLTPEEAALYALPAHLRQTSAQKSEEMLSNQMLNGIPEVDLGMNIWKGIFQ